METKLGAVKVKDGDTWIDLSKPVELYYGNDKDTEKNNSNDKEAFIGRGYDLINGSCFTKENLKARVFYPRENKVTFLPSTSDDVSFSIVDEKSKVTESLAIAMKLNVGFGIFKGEVKAAYEGTSEDTCETLYAVASYFYKKGVEDYAFGSVSNILEDGVLDPTFKKVINDPQVSPQRIMIDYGTHVLANGVVRGARLNYYLRTANRNHKDTESLKGALKAKFGSAFSANANLEKTKGFENEITETYYKFYQVGGAGADEIMGLASTVDGFDKACIFWKKSLQEAGKANEIASVGTVIPLWEFAEDPVRRKQLELYMTVGVDLVTSKNKEVALKHGELEFDRIAEIPEGLLINASTFTNIREELIRQVAPNLPLDFVKENMRIFIRSVEDENLDIEDALRRDFPAIDTEGVKLPVKTLRKYFTTQSSRDGDYLTMPIELRIKSRDSSISGWGHWDAFSKWGKH